LYEARTFTRSGKTYRLTERQNDAVKVIVAARERGLPRIAVQEILRELGTPGSRLKHSFRTHDGPKFWVECLAVEERGKFLRLKTP
jgi:hypothetical protein